MTDFDVAIVGAGIIGLAHAWEAVKQGQRVVVLEKDAQANGASIRNFGFITVSGQASGRCWQMARDSVAVWDQIAPQAGISIVQHGALIAARRPESQAVLEEFLETDMGTACRLLEQDEARSLVPNLSTNMAILHSPHERRMESPCAIRKLSRWLARTHGVSIHYNTLVTDVQTPRISTSDGEIFARRVVVCSNGDPSLFAPQLRSLSLRRASLQMMRLVPQNPVPQRCVVLGDLTLARYLGFQGLPSTGALTQKLDQEQPEHRRCGVHLIVAQNADGSLIVGDSHEYALTPDPFLNSHMEDLILDELNRILKIGPFRVQQRWQGTYPVSTTTDTPWQTIIAPDMHTRVVLVAAGCGASIAFGLAAQTMRDLLS